MLVANCVFLKLTRKENQAMIEGLFDDNRRNLRECAFSIHNIAKEGLEKFKVYPGTEYSIPQITQVFQNLAENYKPLEGIHFLAFSDGTLELS